MSSIISKLYLSLLLIVAHSTLSYSQTSKSLWMTGGNLGFNRYEDQTRLYLSASGGYLLTDHLAVGASLNFSSFFSEWIDNYYTGLFPYVRYYFGSGKTQPVLLASAGYAYNHYNTSSSVEFLDSSWDFRWNVGAGVSHFINQNAALEGILRYRESFSISFGFQIFFGRANE